MRSLHIYSETVLLTLNIFPFKNDTPMNVFNTQDSGHILLISLFLSLLFRDGMFLMLALK